MCAERESRIPRDAAVEELGENCIFGFRAEILCFDNPARKALAGASSSPRDDFRPDNSRQFRPEKAAPRPERGRLEFAKTRYLARVYRGRVRDVSGARFTNSKLAGTRGRRAENARVWRYEWLSCGQFLVRAEAG